MSEQEKIAIIAECMDVEESDLELSSVLADFDEWDSVAALSFIAALDEHFGKTITADDIKALTTVEDALKIME